MEHPYPLTVEAKKVWLNEVKRLIDTPFTLYTPMTEDNLVSLTINKGSLDPVFDTNIITYNASLPAGTTSVLVTATSTGCGTVSGTGNINVSSGSGTANVVSTAEDGVTSKTYTINFTVATEIRKFEMNNVKIYPNPAKSNITIELNKTIKGSEVSISDLQGRTLINEAITGEMIKLNTNTLNNGVYFVKIKSNKQAFTKRIVIKK